MVYKWYILPIGGLHGTYHLLREPGNSIDCVTYFKFNFDQLSRLLVKIDPHHEDKLVRYAGI